MTFQWQIFKNVLKNLQLIAKNNIKNLIKLFNNSIPFFTIKW